MRFLFLVVVIAFVLYAAVTMSLYGSIDPCRALAEEIVDEALQEAERKALDRGEPGLGPDERRDVETRTRRGAEARIRERDLSYPQCLRLLFILKREGAGAEEVRPVVPPRP